MSRDEAVKMLTKAQKAFDLKALQPPPAREEREFVEHVRYVAEKMGFGDCKGCRAMTVSLSNALQNMASPPHQQDDREAMEAEIQRLREYEFMYKDLCK